jgi:hypothetical protein
MTIETEPNRQRIDAANTHATIRAAETTDRSGNPDHRA